MLLSNVLNRNLPEKPELSTNSVFISNSYVGIEIEMEGVASSSLQNIPSWQRVSEGSVNGFELVLRSPMCGDQLYLAIQQLTNVSSNTDLSNAFSERTSNHVHIDVTDLTYIQFINFLTLSVMFEKVLYKYVAPHRSSNHFCWTFFDCQDIISRIKAVNEVARTENYEALRQEMCIQFDANHTKYSGINVSSVPRYGSLEFRMHEGTMDVNKIIRWVNILMSIKDYAKDEGRTPNNILETKQEVGIDSIFTAVLGNYRGVLTYPGVDLDILQGIRSAQDFVYQVTTTETRNVNRELPSIDTGSFNRLLSSLDNELLTAAGRERISNANSTNNNT